MTGKNLKTPGNNYGYNCNVRTPEFAKIYVNKTRISAMKISKYRQRCIDIILQFAKCSCYIITQSYVDIVGHCRCIS